MSFDMLSSLSGTDVLGVSGPFTLCDRVVDIIGRLGAVCVSIWEGKPEKQRIANLKLELVYAISTTLSLIMPNSEASDSF